MRDWTPWTLFALIVVLGAAFILFYPLPARGHSFYDAYCCSGQDCEAADDSRVRVVAGGYLIDGKHYVPESQARVTPPGFGNYHVCFWPNPETLRCFYRALPGS